MSQAGGRKCGPKESDRDRYTSGVNHGLGEYLGKESRTKPRGLGRRASALLVVGCPRDRAHRSALGRLRVGQGVHECAGVFFQGTGVRRVTKRHRRGSHARRPGEAASDGPQRPINSQIPPRAVPRPPTRGSVAAVEGGNHHGHQTIRSRNLTAYSVIELSQTSFAGRQCGSQAEPVAWLTRHA